MSLYVHSNLGFNAITMVSTRTFAYNTQLTRLYKLHYYYSSYYSHDDGFHELHDYGDARYGNAKTVLSLRMIWGDIYRWLEGNPLGNSLENDIFSNMPSLDRLYVIIFL